MKQIRTHQDELDAFATSGTSPTPPASARSARLIRLQAEARARHTEPAPAAPLQSSVVEPLLTPADVSRILKVSVSTVTRRFRGRPGVMNLGSPATRSKRGYGILRISRPALDAFLNERSGGAA